MEKLNSSFINEINSLISEKSFEIESIENQIDNEENDINIVYLKKKDIPNIKIINKNLMICDEEECKISDYIEQINNYIKKIEDIDVDNKLNDLLDDNKYDFCSICKENSNEYFCEICKKNMCQKCYEMF